MPTYVIPQVQVFQDLQLRPTNEVQPLNAFIAGGHAALYRYDQADEKALVSLGEYDHIGQNIDGEFKTCYSWPQKAATAVIDTSYTRLFIDNALLRYWNIAGGTMVKTASNKIRHPSKAFKDNPLDPTTYPRSADFLDRDVAVGDAVSVVGSSDGGTTTYSLSTYVRDIEADEVASSIASATSDAANKSTQLASESHSDGASNTGTAVVSSVSYAGWNGLAVGLISETYTITVTQSSTGSDHTTARLQVVSASGLDDDLNFTPVAAGGSNTVGALGMSFILGAGTLVAGDTYTITVNMAWEAPTATSGGSYTGTADRTYIVEVTTGGLYGQSPQITVTTADGTDFSGPHTVDDIYTGTTTTTTTNAPGEADTPAIVIGNYGVTIAFSGSGLCKGDRYVIVATAAAPGAYRTLVLGHSLDALIPTSDAATADLEVALYIRKNIEVGAQHVSVPGQYNWEQSNTELCVFAGIYAYDSTYTDGGVPVALPLITDAVIPESNEMYVEYRAWQQTLTDSVYSISDVGDIDTVVSGGLTPDNPLKWALYKALSNNNGQEVKFMAVADPSDTSAWVTVIDKIEERDDVYGLVPLTKDLTILNLFAAHVQAASTETAARWRVLWTSLENATTQVVADTTTAGTTILATTEDDPDTSGTQYTILRAQTGMGYFADVVAGDVVRYQYTADAWGTVTYSEYVVAAVIDDDTLRLATGTTVAESVPKKAEVHRNLTAQAQAEALAVKSGTWASRRVMSVWPDVVSSGGTEMQGYHLCAALAALANSVVPHQGLTNLEITGFDDISQTTRKFNKTQLNTMAVAGTWIVTQDLQDGKVFTRHAVTTGDYEDINEREEQITRNLDSISYYFAATFAPYIGIANNTPSMLDIIEAETNSAIQFLRNRGETQMLGGQLIDAQITQLRPSIEFADRIVLGLSLNLPVALNNIELHLLV